MKTRRACAVLALVSAGLIAPAARPEIRAVQELPPAVLYQSLLQTPVAASSLPAGYRSPRVGAATPSARAKLHHVLGEVDVLASKNGSVGARVTYIVFPTHADALADWTDGLRHSPKTHLLPPSSVPQPAVMFNAPATAKVAYGATVLGHLTGNLIVEVETTSLSNAAHGDEQGAIALARFALTLVQTLGQRRA